ncbi:Hypothetical predicted protein [Octopus vulgaris]|uniref:Uncharacterized protein n=1 Tax=Octopus vulgaris TaxID=6645 RepID=A0AA36AX14_OCTVU|nr:Hypothetical predicted protein [Octopus vulgaris]
METKQETILNKIKKYRLLLLLLLLLLSLSLSLLHPTTPPNLPDLCCHVLYFPVHPLGPVMHLPDYCAMPGTMAAATATTAAAAEEEIVVEEVEEEAWSCLSLKK